MDVYRATFRAPADGVSQVRDEFMFVFGYDAYTRLVKPYIDRGVSYIWFAPPSDEVEWFINQLGYNAADREGGVFTPIHLERDNNPVISCPRCGLLTPYPMNGICLPCYEDEIVEKYKDSHS